MSKKNNTDNKNSKRALQENFQIGTSTRKPPAERPPTTKSKTPSKKGE